MWILTALCGSATTIRTTGSARRRESFNSRSDAKAFLAEPAGAAALAHAKDDLSIPGNGKPPS